MSKTELYHYTKAEHALSILNSLEFKLSFSATLNDPFDLNKDIIYDPDDKDSSKLVRAVRKDRVLQNKLGMRQTNDSQLVKSIHNALDDFSNHFKSIIQNTPIISLSSTHQEHLMWAHYCQGYTGVVIALKKTSNTCIISKAEKVSYRPGLKLPTIISASRFISFWKNENSEIHKFGRDLLIQKHKKWEYEKEYRVICAPTHSTHIYKKNDEGYFFAPINPQQISAIYFGLKIKDEDKVKIKETLKKDNLSHVKCYEMQKRPGYIQINFKELP